MAGLAPTLPFELWSTIAHFLNADVLSANFALCRAFLYAYLRMKYYTAHFGEFTSPQAFIAFKRLSEPSLALYVRSLSIFLPKMPVIMPSTLPCSSMVARGNRKRSWRAPWSSRTSSHEDTTPSPADGMVISEAELLSIIFGMKKLETLHIESFIPHRWSPDAFWSTFRWSLRSLTFTSGNISSWRLKDAVCDSLSDLTIRSACQCGHEAQWSFPSLNKNMGQFINAHSGTLRSLAMTIIVCSSCKYDNRLLLESMARLSMLETLFLTFTSSFVKSGQAEQVKTADAVQGLIYSTRLPVLKHLILSVPRALYSSILSMPDPNSHVPPLQSYELRSIVADNNDWEPRRIAADLPGLRSHLGHFVSTLTKLDIGALIFTSEELKQVISLFSGCSLHSMGASSSLQTSSPLTDFRCSVEHIDAAIFLYIAATLPQLQTFSLGYVTFRPTPSDLVLPHLPRLGGLTLPTQVFMSELQASGPFTNWGLEHLSIRTLQYWPWVSCKETVVDAFPQVKTFNGASREEYLSARNMARI